MINIQTLTLKSHLLKVEDFKIFNVDYNIFKINKYNEIITREFYFKSFDFEVNGRYYFSQAKVENKHNLTYIYDNNQNSSSKK